jgi:hypothetical protein
MKTINDLFNEASKEQKTLSEIAKESFNIELSGFEYFAAYKEPFCTKIKVEEAAKCFIIFFKYECKDISSMNYFSNGFRKAVIEKDGFIFDIDRVSANNIIEM